MSLGRTNVSGWPQCEACGRDLPELPDDMDRRGRLMRLGWLLRVTYRAPDDEFVLQQALCPACSPLTAGEVVLIPEKDNPT